MLNWFVTLCAATLLTFGCRPDQPPAAPARPAESSQITAPAQESVLLMSADPAKNLELGEGYYRRGCASCHDTGAAGTPQLGDIAAWKPRIAQGLDTLVHHAIDGHGSSACAMPPRGGHPDLHIEAVALAVRYMVEMSLPEGQRLQPATLQQAPAPGLATAEIQLFLQPIQAELVDYAAAALPSWRQQRNLHPTLVLLTNDPLLQPLPESLRRDIKSLLETGSPAQIIAKSNPSIHDPLLKPAMTVSAALDAGLFSRVIWVLPTPTDEGELSLETFRQQLLGIGAISQAEAETLALRDGRFAGTIRGVPWEIVPIQGFSGAQGPAVVHLEIGFFTPLHRNEIKTPLYALVRECLFTLRDAKLDTRAVTISSPQLTGELPLNIRFLARDIAALTENPALLDGELPLNWARRQDARYLQNFIQKEKVHALYQEMEQADPQDASVQFALYQSYRELNRGGEALKKLSQAVALDPVYALEYLALAEVARQKGRPEDALRMFGLAQGRFPDNPFIALEKARLLTGQGQGREAALILEQLRQLPWSPVYYPSLPKVIAKEQETAAKSSEAPPARNPH